MLEWYYILGIISYGIFLVQFVLSFILGDFDIDVDFDGNSDFDSSSILSFKGLIHFLMGFSGWLMLIGKVTLIHIIIGILFGIVFIVLLYYIYKLCMKFNSQRTINEGKSLIGKSVQVLYIIDSQICVCSIENGGITQEITCINNTSVKPGQSWIITEYKNGCYYI